MLARVFELLHLIPKLEVDLKIDECSRLGLGHGPGPSTLVFSNGIGGVRVVEASVLALGRHFADLMHSDMMPVFSLQ